jgi:cobalt-zinc-cadmium efflux system membrane fusion protein
LKFLTNGYASVLSIALIGVAFGLWTRSSSPSCHVSDASTRGVFVSKSGLNESEAHDAKPLAMVSKVSVSRHLATNTDDSEAEGVEGIEGGEANPSVPSVEMLPGIAHPLQVAEISAAADGPLWKLFVAEGDTVDENAVLALIDNRVAVASVIAAQSSADRQAMLDAARAKVSLAEQFLNRIEQAASKKAASGLEVDEAMSRLLEAKAALQEGRESQRDALARLKIEQARLETYEIRAPFQGTVIKISPHLGETVSRGAPIVKIADINRLRAELYVPLVLVTSQKVGEVVELRADLPNRPLLKAKIVFIAPLVDAATQTIRVVVEIENSDKQLPAGFAVRLSQTSARSDMH